MSKNSLILFLKKTSNLTPLTYNIETKEPTRYFNNFNEDYPLILPIINKDLLEEMLDDLSASPDDHIGIKAYGNLSLAFALRDIVDQNGCIAPNLLAFLKEHDSNHRLKNRLEENAALVTAQLIHSYVTELITSSAIDAQKWAIQDQNEEGLITSRQNIYFTFTLNQNTLLSQDRQDIDTIIDTDFIDTIDDHLWDIMMQPHFKLKKLQQVIVHFLSPYSLFADYLNQNDILMQLDRRDDLAHVFDSIHASSHLPFNDLIILFNSLISKKPLDQAIEKWLQYAFYQALNDLFYINGQIRSSIQSAVQCDKDDIFPLIKAYFGLLFSAIIKDEKLADQHETINFAINRFLETKEKELHTKDHVAFDMQRYQLSIMLESMTPEQQQPLNHTLT